jgi:uncharacterized protein YwqG
VLAFFRKFWSSENHLSVGTDITSSEESVKSSGPEVERILATIKQMQKPSIALHYRHDTLSTQTLESRLGGCPAWPVDLDLPFDQTGRPMLFLAQIRLDDIPDALSLPEKLKSGLLQFFVNDDSSYGCKFPSIGTSMHPKENQANEGFRIVHHTDLESLEVRPLDAFTHPKFGVTTPVEAISGYIVTPVVSSMRPSISSYHVQDLLDDAPDEIIDHVYERLAELDVDAIGLNIGGYPDFAQEDPRIYGDGSMRSATFPLLSISQSAVVSIYDDGKMHFLIDPNDLIKGDFSKVIYTWD